MIANATDQGKLFEFDVVHSPVDLEDATPDMAYDFLNWIKWDNRTQSEVLWRRFQRYLERRPK